MADITRLLQATDPHAADELLKLVYKERRPSGACSRLSELAPACSPDAARPWSSRSATSRIGASSPMLS